MPPHLLYIYYKREILNNCLIYTFKVWLSLHTRIIRRPQLDFIYLLTALIIYHKTISSTQDKSDMFKHL